jgi:hypothetical protein
MIKIEKGRNTLAPSGAGNSARSTKVISTFLNKGLLHSEYEVERPKTPDPMMSIDLGRCSDEVIVERCWAKQYNFCDKIRKEFGEILKPCIYIETSRKEYQSMEPARTIINIGSSLLEARKPFN